MQPSWEVDKAGSWGDRGIAKLLHSSYLAGKKILAMWDVFLQWLAKLFGSGTTQIGRGNQSASDVSTRNTPGVVAVGQGITVNQTTVSSLSKIPFADIEKQLAELVNDMRQGLKEHPFVLEFVTLGKGWLYNGDPNHPVLAFYFEDHPHLRDKLRILEHHRLIREITYNDVDRFIFLEEFVEYLTK
jgi:hypothetical protein